MFNRPWSPAPAAGNGGRPKPPFVIAVSHQKGGVAKTTTSLTLGAALAEQFFEAVLLVDLDPQGNLTTGLGVDPTAAVNSAAGSLLDDKKLVQISVQTRMPGLELVPCNPDMLNVSKQLYELTGYEYKLRDCINEEMTAFYYDVVVIDCPPQLGPLTLSALTAADLVIVPFQCEYFAVHALENVLRLVRVIRNRTNPGLQYRLLVTMFDRRGALHTNVLTKVETRYAESLFTTMIGIDSKVRESQLVGSPVLMHAPRTRAAVQYRALAQEVFYHVRRQHLQAA
ncbi:MAG TPA: ParA family protein [Anaerolineales bacterium]|nr:ParA family protein [Anaerolineales bacterium]